MAFKGPDWRRGPLSALHYQTTLPPLIEYFFLVLLSTTLPTFSTVSVIHSAQLSETTEKLLRLADTRTIAIRQARPVIRLFQATGCKMDGMLRDGAAEGPGALVAGLEFFSGGEEQ